MARRLRQGEPLLHQGTCPSPLSLLCRCQSEMRQRERAPARPITPATAFERLFQQGDSVRDRIAFQGGVTAKDQRRGQAAWLIQTAEQCQTLPPEGKRRLQFPLDKASVADP